VIGNVAGSEASAMSDCDSRLVPEQVAHLPTVLVVEDELLLRQTVADYLGECGYCVIEAADGDKAREMLDGGATIDLVFSDVRMPGQMDGLALAQWIRQHRPSIPVILTSGYAGTALPPAAVCDCFLDKPYGPTEILQHIAALIQNGSRGGSI
jgi:CheY-like chemotaxis protein